LCLYATLFEFLFCFRCAIVRLSAVDDLSKPFA
jgi:hypothetical protein